MAVLLICIISTFFILLILKIEGSNSTKDKILSYLSLCHRKIANIRIKFKVMPKSRLLSLTGKKTEKIDTNTAKTDYNKYSFSPGEYFIYLLQASILLFAIGFMFFRNIVLSLVLCSLSAFYLPVKKKSIIKKRKNGLRLQFRDLLQSLSYSLSDGRSVESAFNEALNDLKILYPYDDCAIIKELTIINRKISLNEPVEKVLADFAKRSGIDDIENFNDVFSICKSTGGNLVEVIRNTTSVINQKIEIMNEIDVIIAEKKFSQEIMSVTPFGLLMLISTGSPDYIEPLFNARGHLVMFAVLILLAASYFLGAKIMDIEV